MGPHVSPPTQTERSVTIMCQNYRMMNLHITSVACAASRCGPRPAAFRKAASDMGPHLSPPTETGRSVTFIYQKLPDDEIVYNYGRMCSK